LRWNIWRGIALIRSRIGQRLGSVRRRRRRRWRWYEIFRHGVECSKDG
jgi:hypothetical protein